MERFSGLGDLVCESPAPHSPERTRDATQAAMLEVRKLVAPKGTRTN